jgi:hypothetical protein
MALRLFRASAACVASMTASVAGAGAQTFVTEAGRRGSVDLGTAPVLPSPPVPPIDFDRPTPKSGMTAHRAVRQRGAAQTKRLSPDSARDRQ